MVFCAVLPLAYTYDGVFPFLLKQHQKNKKRKGGAGICHTLSVRQQVLHSVLYSA